MHTYTPTASHDPVVEFDNGDLGNQTNLNNMVRALGNRSQLAKETNDTQASALDVLQAYSPRLTSPSVLDAVVSISATGNGGSYTGGENVFALSKQHLSGRDMGSAGTTDLDTATYTGSGGGTKVIRIAPYSRYLMHLDIVLDGADESVSAPAPNEWTRGLLRVDIGDDTGVSVNVTTLKDVTGTPSLEGLPANPQSVNIQFCRTILIRNTTGAARYVRMRLIDPVDNGTYTVIQGSVVVQFIGNI